MKAVGKHLYDVFTDECALNGKAFGLPSPLSKRTVQLVSATTYWWQGFMRLPGQTYKVLWEGESTWKECMHFD